MIQSFSVPGPLPGANRKVLANRRYRDRQKGLVAPLLVRPWTQDECEALREAYRINEGSKAPWLKSIAKLFGRHPANVVRKALSLGCMTSLVRVRPFDLKSPFMQKKILSARQTREEKNKAISERMKVLWKRIPHPRGMLGKTHSVEIRERMSASRIGVPKPPRTKEHRLKLSRSAAARLQGNPASFSKRLNRGIFGRREDLGGQFFRSRYEANYARFLNFSNIEWTYEKKTFWFDKIKRGVRSYTPDFYLPATNEFHEVKGWMDARSKTKLKRMKKYFPEVKVVVVGGDWFKAANKQGMCRVVPGWECNHKRHTAHK